jgi:hypothetical protein
MDWRELTKFITAKVETTEAMASVITICRMLNPLALRTTSSGVTAFVGLFLSNIFTPFD